MAVLSGRIRAWAIACTLLVGVYAVAEAHATLVSAEPAAGSHLPMSAARVRLVFSEALEVSLAQISLVGPDGKATRLAIHGDPHDVDAIIAPTPSLAAGAYRVEWRVVSDDGHPVAGSYVFSVGAADSATATPPPIEGPRGIAPAAPAAAGWSPTILGAPSVPALLRGTSLGLLLAFAGLLCFMARPREIAEQLAAPLETVARAIGVAATVTLLLSFVAWTVNAAADHQLSAANISAAWATNEGGLEVWRVVMVMLALWALWLAARVRLAVIFAVTAVIMSGHSGHSAAISPLWATPAKSVHLLASAVWLGGLVWLIARARGEPASFKQDAARLSSAALVAAGLVLLSGVMQSWLFLPTLHDLIGSNYGLVILAKTAGFAVLVAFGAKHRFVMLPGLAGDGSAVAGFASSLRREIFVMCIVVLIGGLLAYVPTPARSNSTSSHLALHR